MRTYFLPFFIALLCFLSALTLVLVRHENRLLFVELQRLQHNRDELEREWSRLQLEYSTLANPSRVDRLARRQLKMYSPTPEEIVVINLSGRR
jgi:cell division protein FtsL